jgi:thiamine kinase-like enzyme
VVTLSDGATVFVKFAVDDQTANWIRVEEKAYHWLERAGYRHIPRLLAEGSQGFALADLSNCDWSHTWDEGKIDAMLTALDDLAKLPVEGADFEQSTFPADPWRTLASDTELYKPFLEEETLRRIEPILRDEKLREEYAAMADAEPWRGTQLVHYDARSDNFAYDRASGVGYLVDWDWIGLGNAAFDRTGLLVNVQLAGYDVLTKYRERLDKASLIWLMGFWLKAATGLRDTKDLERLRARQVENALVAQELIRQL